MRKARKTEPKNTSETKKVIKFGHVVELRQPEIKSPYSRIMIGISGITPIAGPTCPMIDVWMTMLDARVRSGKIDRTIRDRLLSEVRNKQVERMMSDENGDASGQIVTENVSGSVNMFVRDTDGCLGIEGRTLRAALREGFSRSGQFVKNRGSREEFSHGMNVRPWFLRFVRDGKELKEADEIESHPVHVWAGGGMRNSITQYEVIYPPWEIEAMIDYREEGSISYDGIEQALGLLPTVRLGAQRSMGFGSCELLWISNPVKLKKV